VDSSLARNRFLLVYLAFIVLTLSGCNISSSNPLPTYVPTLGIPPTPARIQLRSEVPATFTAEPAALEDSEVIQTEELEPTPTLRPTASFSPTPLNIAVNIYNTVEAPFHRNWPDQIPCESSGYVFKSQYSSEVGGSSRGFHAYLPPCYGTDNRGFPVIYLIHGSIQDSTHWLKLGLAQYAKAGIEEGRFPPFIAIMPDSGYLGNISSGGDKSIEGIIVNSLLPFIDQNFCTWSEAGGRTIGGISRGGYWALETAFRNPEHFSAAAGHSSHLRLETDPEKYNPLATYALADLTNLRIWMDRGEKDFLRVGQDQLHTNLTTAGIAHEYWVNPGGHSDAYWAEHLGEYLDWHTAEWPKARELYPLCD